MPVDVVLPRQYRFNLRRSSRLRQLLQTIGYQSPKLNLWLVTMSPNPRVKTGIVSPRLYQWHISKIISSAVMEFPEVARKFPNLFCYVSVRMCALSSPGSSIRSQDDAGIIMDDVARTRQRRILMEWMLMIINPTASEHVALLVITYVAVLMLAGMAIFVVE